VLQRFTAFSNKSQFELIADYEEAMSLSPTMTLFCVAYRATKFYVKLLVSSLVCLLQIKSDTQNKTETNGRCEDGVRNTKPLRS
jgi:hypothetical protein